jgi:PadR family transcriptional regulator
MRAFPNKTCCSRVAPPVRFTAWDRHSWSFCIYNLELASPAGIEPSINRLRVPNYSVHRKRLVVNKPCRPIVLLALYVFVVVEPEIAERSCDMSREALGEFEHMVLLAILHLGEGVYGVPIVDEIQRRTGRTVAPAAVYITLRRLEQKGLLTSCMSDSTPERGGKARRCVKVTGAGLDSLRESRKVLDSMWKGLDRKLRSAQ